MTNTFLKVLRWLLLIAAGAMILGSWLMIGRATEGLVVERWSQDGLPVRYVGPAGGENLPGVIIAHGFSGSQQLMLGYNIVLAHAGYGTLSLDFSGHAANPAPLDTGSEALAADLEKGLAALRSRPEVDPQRIALLGHSMGSGAVMRAGLARPEAVEAVLAVSPTDAPVTPDAPPNLYFQAGELEGRFAERARELLAQAGGTRTDPADFAAGQARDFDLIPGVEHITILFSDGSHEGARRWLDQVFGAQTTEPTFQDRRMVWYLLHLLAWLVAIPAAAPLWQSAMEKPRVTRSRPWSWLLLIVAPLAATGLLYLLNLSTPVRELGGILVGGALAIWFFAFGFLWLLGGFAPLPFRWQDLLWGVLLFALLTLAFGVMAPLAWAPWWMIPTRLARLPFFLLAMLPWQLAAAEVQIGDRWWPRFFWWLGQTFALGGALLLVVRLVPGMSFVTLILPLLPVLLAIMAIAGAAFGRRPWAAALGNAAFFAWVMVVVFPLSG